MEYFVNQWFYRSTNPYSKKKVIELDTRCLCPPFVFFTVPLLFSYVLHSDGAHLYSGVLCKQSVSVTESMTSSSPRLLKYLLHTHCSSATSWTLDVRMPLPLNQALPSVVQILCHV